MISRQATITGKQQLRGGRQQATARRGSLGRNIPAAALNLVGTGLATLWFTPYLTSKLGFTAYGLVALAVSLIPYLSVVTVLTNSAVARHVTVHLEQSDQSSASRVFSSCVWLNLALAAIALPIGVLAITHANLLFVVPPAYVNELKALLSCVLAVFVLISMGIPFQSAMTATNRLDISNMISLGYSLVRVGVVVLIFQFAVARAAYVGVGLLTASVLSLIAAIITWRVFTPGLCLSHKLVNRTAVHELTSTGWWALVDAAGTLLFFGADLVIVNRLLGPHAGGQYAAVMQWPLIIRSAMIAASPVFMPPMMYLFARSDLAGLGRYCNASIRMFGLAAAVPIGLICGLSKSLLAVWLGNQAALYAPLLVLMTLHLAVNMSLHPLLCMQLSANKVKTPAIASLLVGIGNIILAVFLAGRCGWGMYGVAAAGVISLTIRMLVFAPIYAARTLGIRSSATYREVFLVAVVALAMASGSWLLSSRVTLGSWLAIAAAATGAVAVCALIAVQWAKSSSGRQSVKMVLAELRGGSIA